MEREIILKGKVINGGVFQGEAIVSKAPFGFYRAVDPETGIVRDRRNELFGQRLCAKVLVFPEGRGSTSGAMTILELARWGTHFGAILNRITEPIVATGVILARKFYGRNIPMIHLLDPDPLEVIETGDMVRVDGENGIVIVRKRLS